MLKIDGQVDQTLKKQFIPTKQQLLDDKGSIDNIPESQQTDTGHFPQQPVEANSTAHENIDLDINLLHEQPQSEDGQDFAEEDTLVLIPDGLNNEHCSTTTDDTGECTTIKVSKPTTEPPILDEVSMPIENVGWIFLTIHLHKYLDEYL